MSLSRPHRRPLILTGLGGAVSLILTLLSAYLPDDDFLAGYQTDLMAGLRAWIFEPAPPEAPPVAIVGLDQRSLDHPRLAPWPRAMFTPVWAMLAEKAYAHGARVVALDFIVAYDAGELARSGLPDLRNYDKEFLRILHKYGRNGRFVMGRSAEVRPAPRFSATGGAGALGMVEIPLGPGNVAREVQSSFTVDEGETLPTLSGLARSAMGAPASETVHLVPPWRLDSYPTVSLIDVLTCDDPAVLDRFFSGRAIFVGSVLAIEDRVRAADRLIPASPRGAGRASGEPCDLVRPLVRSGDDAALPGVYMHAAATDAALSGWAPSPAPKSVVAAAVAALALCAALTALFLPLRLGIVVAVAMVLAVPVAGAVLLQEGVLLASSDPLWTPAAAFVAASSLRLGLLDRQARVLRRQFEQYLSPVIIARMIDDNILPQMGGESRDVTVMFADLSGFTAFSSQVDSQRLMTVLNRYLDLMAEEIRESGGYVDKFIGDAVMAMWNAPAPQADHAAIALRTALRLYRHVETAGAAMAKEGMPALKVKVGLNSGLASVGNIGAQNRRDYSVVGSTVNIAARLEGLPPRFRTSVVMGPGTAERLDKDWRLLRIASVHVKGVPEPLPVFTPVAGPDLPESPHLDQMLGGYAVAAAAFTAGDFEAAQAGWQDLAGADWPGAGPAGAMADMARRLVGNPPPGWDGVIDFGAK